MPNRGDREPRIGRRLQSRRGIGTLSLVPFVILAACPKHQPTPAPSVQRDFCVRVVADSIPLGTGLNGAGYLRRGIVVAAHSDDDARQAGVVFITLFGMTFSADTQSVVEAPSPGVTVSADLLRSVHEALTRCDPAAGSVTKSKDVLSQLADLQRRTLDRLLPIVNRTGVSPVAIEQALADESRLDPAQPPVAVQACANGQNPFTTNCCPHSDP
jgi:hypothetical protein